MSEEYRKENLSKIIEKIILDYLNHHPRIFMGKARKIVNNNFWFYGVPIVICSRKPKGLVELPELPHSILFNAVKSSNELYAKPFYKFLNINREVITSTIARIIDDAAEEYFGYRPRYNENIIYKKGSKQILLDKKKVREKIKEKVEIEIKNIKNFVQILYKNS